MYSGSRNKKVSTCMHEVMAATAGWLSAYNLIFNLNEVSYI